MRRHRRDQGLACIGLLFPSQTVVRPSIPLANAMGIPLMAASSKMHAFAFATAGAVTSNERPG